MTRNLRTVIIYPLSGPSSVSFANSSMTCLARFHLIVPVSSRCHTLVRQEKMEPLALCRLLGISTSSPGRIGTDPACTNLLDQLGKCQGLHQARTCTPATITCVSRLATSGKQPFTPNMALLIPGMPHGTHQRS